MRRSAPLSPGSTATVPRFPASPASKNYLQRGTSHLDREAVGSFALRHPPAQDQVGGPTQAGEVVGKKDRVLRLRPNLGEEEVKHVNLNQVSANHHPQELLARWPNVSQSREESVGGSVR